MNWSDCKQIGYESLKPIYGEIEATSILRILHEDLFDKSNSLHMQDLAVFNTSLSRLLENEPVQYLSLIHISTRNALIGSCNAAFCAGKKPKIIPTEMDTPNANTTDHSEITVGIWA